MRRLIFALVLLTAACATTPPVREITVTKEVPVPYHKPCPDAKDKPVVPKRVAEEHPVMPLDVNEQARILAGKVLELFGYADKADGIMTACSKP
jgi:hypothetical protein